MGANVSKEQKSGSGKSRKLGVTLASGSITPDLLTSLWEPMVTEDLLKMFLLRLFRDGGLRSIGPKKLARTYSRMMGGEPVIVSGSKTVTPQAVKDYLAEVWYSYVKVLKYHDVMSMASWTSARAADNAEDVAALVGYLTRSIDGDQVSVGAFKNWMSNTPIVDLVTGVLARAMFSLRPSRTSDCLLPTIVTPECFTTCLAPCQAAWLAWSIRAVECPPWRLIYSTSTHSRSWSQFLKCIVAQGPTLMVVVDQERTSFGLYASTSWQCRSWYYGKYWNNIHESTLESLSTLR
ncbi:hypothetical protein AAG570_007338 [Ranatra chinensis]|uniref:Oxidation resistance protein 1 n=1 Tax=Ranatra chinensis TaxID=642074 RepID=A0ABD0XVK4_9HEMI